MGSILAWFKSNWVALLVGLVVGRLLLPRII